jgi:uncharacterized protein (DUF362 family)
MKIDRRGFLKSTATATAGGVLASRIATAAQKEGKNKKKTTIWVVHGTDPKTMLETGLNKIGGIEQFVKKGGKVTIKPNAAWASRPEQAGNTHPILVGAGIAACKAAGAKEIVLPENPCSSADLAFGQSGIKSAAEAAGGRLYALDNGDYFQGITLPRGKVLKYAEVAKDVINTDCLINMPVVKSHSSAVITVSMKNWMGSVKNRSGWHTGLHQSIADFSTFIKPKLIIADATRVMLTNGPRGPGEVVEMKQIIIGTDPVAVDAYAATLFKKKPFDIPHIKIAHEMKIGCGNLARVDVRHVRLS